MPPPPKPSPIPGVDTSKLDPVALLQKLFSVLGIQADASTCVKDVGDSTRFLRDFASDATHGNATRAVRDLSFALSALSSSVNDCNVPQLQAKLDALAARLHFADIKVVDAVIKVLIDTSEVWPDIKALATAVQSKDISATVAALQKLEQDWSTIAGGCDSDACHVLDGILKIVGIISDDTSNSCATDLSAAVTDIKTGLTDFGNKDYKSGVMIIATGLDDFAQAIGKDACNLGSIANIINKVAPKLANATIDQAGDIVKVIVGSADVYDELYQAASALAKGDLATVGQELGLLLSRLRASNCESKACDILEGLLASLQIVAEDYATCAPDIDTVFQDFGDAIEDLKDGNLVAGVQDLGTALNGLAKSVNDCGITNLLTVLETTLQQLGDAVAAQEVGNFQQILVDGVAIDNVIQQAKADFAAGNYAGFGQDLGQLSHLLSDAALHCDSWVCHLVEGILSQFDIFFSDLQACEADLKTAETDLLQGFNQFQQRDYKDGVDSMAKGLRAISQLFKDCGIADELQNLQHEANALGIANITVTDEIVKIAQYGSDFFNELSSAVLDAEAGDYRAAGQDLGHVLHLMAAWTGDHSCSSDMCSLVSGVLAFVADFSGSIKQCERDFTLMFGNFSAAYHDFTDENSLAWEFRHDKDKIRKAVGEIGVGFSMMANSVSDCDLPEVAELLAQIAAKLGTSPEIEIAEEVVKILIDGVQIEQEVAEACTDYADQNWIGFGYNIAKLLKMLL